MTQPKSSKLGIIVRSDLGGGLQSQTLNLTRMLKPARVLHIDSKPFNGKDPDLSMYEGFSVINSRGFPNVATMNNFTKGLTHILTAETFYGYGILLKARQQRILTFNQVNYEFCENVENPTLPTPSMWLMPSYWYLEEMIKQFGNVEYLPPPIFTNDFKEARDTNIARNSEKKRFVHVVGKQASSDRNGTEDVLNALRYCRENFELVIRSQYDLPYKIDDRRVTFDIGNKLDQYELYQDFDAMIMPRRYGGLCLPMNEALSSALPVIMTDISPNNRVLPENWLVQVDAKQELRTRMIIDVYRSDYKDLARKIDMFAKMTVQQLDKEKLRAFEIGFENYEASNLKDRYIKVMGL